MDSNCQRSGHLWPTTLWQSNMYWHYRVVELLENKPEVVHPEIYGIEMHAIIKAEEIVRNTHNSCTIERNTGSGWKKANRIYFWFGKSVFYRSR